MTEEHVKSHWDLSHGNICSIDPSGCTDIDDALHFKRIIENGIEIGAHNADVTSFVTHGYLLDRETDDRGCTVYLIDLRIEMLPSLLSRTFCSLHAEV